MIQKHDRKVNTETDRGADTKSNANVAYSLQAEPVCCEVCGARLPDHYIGTALRVCFWCHEFEAPI